MFWAGLIPELFGSQRRTSSRPIRITCWSRKSVPRPTIEGRPSQVTVNDDEADPRLGRRASRGTVAPGKASLQERPDVCAAVGTYPTDVWLFLVAAQWQRISQAEAFVGRCGTTGNDHPNIHARSPVLNSAWSASSRTSTPNSPASPSKGCATPT